MADCEYQIAGDDRIYSESEFKKLLSEGYLDKVMLENQVKVRGIKPNEELAKSFQLPSAVKPAVTTEVKTEETIQPTVTTEDISTKKANIEKKREDELKAFENKNNVGNLADGKGDFVIDLTSPDGKKYKNEVNAKYDAELSKLEATPTEPVTKAEEKVTEPTAKVKEVVSDDKVAEEYAKSTNSDIEAAKKSISDVEKYNNGEMSPKEYLESQGYSEKNFFEVGADREVKDFSDLTEEEFKEVADRKASYANNRINEIKQKVQAEPVTEPTVEEQDKVAEKAGITPKNFRDLYKVNRDLFGLDRLKSFTNAIAMDRMIGTMARRAGVDKSEMYGRLQFEKSTEKDLPKGVKLQVDAWHGSPYQFDKFTTEKMGTGEGAQAFGWGLYFTDLKGIAENYAKNLSLPKFDDFIYKFKKASDYSKLNNTAINNIIDFSENYDYDYDKVLDALKRNDYEGDMKDAINFLENNKNLYEKRSKNLYKVSLHKGKTPDQYTWLEWDKKITKDQIDKIIDGDIDGTIQQALYDSFIDEFMVSTPQDLKEVVLNDLELTGKELYDILSQNVYDSNDNPTPKAASIALLNAGIDGIKYPAESISRGATSDTARGFNYVVFDEDAVSIEEAIKFQKDANKARGAAMVAMDGKAVIYALTDPNVSTPLHELAHVYEHYLTDAERNKILKAAGTDTWNTKTSEYFARGFEKYLAEGKSPVESLNKVFDKFKEWLTDIYSGIKGSEIDVKLNKDMKAIYDTILKEGETKPTPETKQPTREAVAAKNMADILRKAKIKMEGGTAMASFLPGFEDVWNGSIEAVSKAIELGGITAGNFRQSIEAGMKALKQTDAYKAITDPKERAKISARYKKILTSAYSEGYNIDTDKLREAEFNDFNQKLEDNKGKTLSAKEFNALKSEAKKFVNDNLPADSYRKSEVQSYVRNNFDKAKTVEDIQKNLDKVNSIMTTKEAKIEETEAKQAEKTRQKTIEEIIELTKPTSSKMIAKNRRTGARKGKISIDAQRQIREMRDQGLFDNDNLQSKTQEELDALKEQIKNIQEQGKAEKKVKTKAERQVKKSGEATILEALSDPNATLDTKEEILDFMNKYNGVVVVNGQTMRKGEFEKYAKENPDDDYSGTNFYLDESADFKKQKEERKGTLKGFRELTMGAIRDLDTYMKDISRGSKELRQWTQDNIINPTKIAIYNKVKNTAKFKGEYRDAVKNIFGRFNAGINYLSKDSGITTDVSGLEGVKPKKINRDQAVHIYGLINNPDKEKAQKNIDRLKSKNHIDTDKVKELVENDPKLMAYYEFLRDMYDKKFREEFGPTIEQLYEMPLDKGYYWPEPAGTSQSVELDLEGFSNKSISMIAPNMKHREPEYNGAFELVNSYDMYNRYVESMVHAKEFIPVIQNSRTLLSDINRPKILEKLKDANKYDDLVDLMKIIYTDKTPFKTTAMDKFANFVAVKSLWNRLKAVPQQASAFINYYNAGWVDGINPLQIISSVVPTSKTELDFALDFYRDNPYLWQRFKGASNQDMKAIEANVDTIVNQYAKGVVDVALFATLSPIKAGDFLATSTPLGGGAFAMAQFKKRLKENGNDYQEAKDFALRRWFEETERTQQPAIDKSIVSTTTYDPKYRFLVPFVSAQNSMGKKIVKAAKDIRDWKNLTQEEKTQAVADSLYYTVIGSIPFSLMSGSLLTLMDVFDEEDEEAKENMLQRVGFDLIADNVMSNIQSLYYVGFIMNGVLNEMRGRSYFNDRPQGETINSLLTFLASFAMADSDWDFLTEDMKKDYFNRFKLKGSELDEFNALTEEEKMDYLTNNAVKTGFIKNTKEAREEFKKMYSEQSRVNRMGKEGMDAFLMFSGIDKPMNLYKDIVRFMDGSGTFAELIYGEGAGTTVSAKPFSENIPNEFFKAMSYKKDNQLFKYYSDFLGEPEEYYKIYPAKRGGPISSPARRQNVNQGKEAAGRVRVRRKRPTRGIDTDSE